MNFISALQNFWTGFWNGFQALPRAMQIFVFLFFLAVIAFIVYETTPRITPDKQFQDQFEKTADTLKATASPVYIAGRIDSLMNYAQNDSQRCSVGGLYLDVAQELAHPLIPQSLKIFLADGERRNVACVAQLADTAERLESHRVSQTAPVHVAAGTTTASQESVLRASTTPRTTAASQVLQALTNAGTSGWVYLGSKALNATVLTYPTIDQTSIPGAGDSVTTSVALNIRKTTDPRTAMGEILRVIPKGSELRLTGSVVGVDHIVNSTKVGYYVWAPITITTRAAVPNTITINKPNQPIQSSAAAPFILISPHHGPTEAYSVGSEVVKIFAINNQRSTSIYVRNIGVKPVTFTLAVSCPVGVSCPSVQRLIKPVGRGDDSSNDYVYTAETVQPISFDWDVTPAN